MFSLIKVDIIKGKIRISSNQIFKTIYTNIYIIINKILITLKA